MDILVIIISLVAILAFGAGLFLFIQTKQLKKTFTKKEQEMGRRMYELAILKELGDRIGYSLNVQNIVDIITGSLHQFIEYDVVSYMLLQPEKIIFKVQLEESVSRKFIDDVKNRMMNSLSALLNQEFKNNQIDEVLVGAIVVDEVEEPVRSFFNIPLVIAGNVVGVLTVADTKVGLYKEEETTILYKITQQASQAVTRLQEVIKTEQGKLNAMVESMTEGVVMTDKDYRVVVANPAIRKTIGIDNKKDITIFDFIDHLEGKFDIRGKLEESVKLDKMLVTEEVQLRERYYQIFVSPVKSSLRIKGEEIIGAVVIFHDITHEKELTQMRENFTSMMVHELRSPLDGIKKMVTVLEKGDVVKDKKTQKEYFELIHQNSSNMLTLVNDLLDVAKLEAGKFEVRAIPNDIRKIIEETEKFFKSSAKSAKISLDSVVDKQIPAEVNFDYGRIGQVLNNLISNALKFTSPGGKTTVGAFLHKKGGIFKKEADDANIIWTTEKIIDLENLPDSIIISITDSGRGIATEKISQLFNKFYQIDNLPESVEIKGTGLGLVIAKGIVESHHGIIGVFSEEGVGSTFYFTLPI
ncbi:MAG: hypothetical protein A3J93_04590 [Candidatus Magasanikbacteria bacterium RIFOXYC2_FULL_42_28]|uniref:histidine kinase n=1 Tax=Candidatus Magasanikbacteria bacterium RIFOXYC2_FULL_42_28 TaxID=1798704 RepID=A0A1F6NX54_9BACT|nr:MAG: hypothetical protein A3J93_04590 [Candidatus Magasanikbacteria bacterium RIFOXYC2_FULL_42_28]